MSEYVKLLPVAENDLFTEENWDLLHDEAERRRILTGLAALKHFNKRLK